MPLDVAVTVIGVFFAVLGWFVVYWLNGPRLRIRAFMFGWSEKDGWRLVVQAINHGRRDTTVKILGVRQKVADGRYSTRTEFRTAARLAKVNGPDLTFLVPADDGRWTWTFVGDDIVSASAPGWYSASPNSNLPCWVIIERRGRTRRVRVSPTEIDEEQLRAMEIDLGWEVTDAQ